MKKLTKSEKVNIVMNMPEVTKAVKLLLACMIDGGIKNYVKADFVFGKDTFTLS